MLAKGTTFYDFAYTFSESERCVWNWIKAVDFSHAARSLFRRVAPNDRHRRIRIQSMIPQDKTYYDGPVFGLKSKFF